MEHLGIEYFRLLAQYKVELLTIKILKCGIILKTKLTSYPCFIEIIGNVWNDTLSKSDILILDQQYASVVNGGSCFTQFEQGPIL